ncbi:MAG TPA: 30S ribosomal protein S16 [Patescibacteria group bacterium]|nr:30S ribosomal protein S16 [Patescibacteria group bacterium]
MVKIKLVRTGKRNQASFRIVAAEARSKRDGEYLAKIGHYTPTTKVLVIDKPMLDAWMAKGAQPTETVASLLKRNSK